MIPVVPKFIFYAGLGFGGRTRFLRRKICSLWMTLFYVNAGMHFIQICPMCVLPRQWDLRRLISQIKFLWVGRIPLRHKKIHSGEQKVLLQL